MRANQVRTGTVRAPVVVSRCTHWGPAPLHWTLDPGKPTVLAPTMKSRALDFLLLLVLFAPPLRAAPPNPSLNKSSRALHELFEADWEYTMEQSPTWASQLGDRRWNDRWDDPSLAALEKRHEHTRQTLEKLGKIDRRKLPAPDQLNYDLFQRQGEIAQEEHGFRWHLIPL